MNPIDPVKLNIADFVPLDRTENDRVIRLEEYYHDPSIFSDISQSKAPKLNEIFESIKEDLKKEELQQSDSSSDSNESDNLTNDETTDAVNNILAVIKEFPSVNPSFDNSGKSSPSKDFSKNHRKIIDIHND